MTDSEKESDPKLETWVRWLLPFYEACPQVAPHGVGGEAFVEDLKNATMKFVSYPGEIAGALQELLPFLRACPQVFSPGIGLEAFAEDLRKAAEKYLVCCKETRAELKELLLGRSGFGPAGQG